MKSLSMRLAAACLVLSLGSVASAQPTQGCSPNNWGMMNYGVCYHVNDPYAEGSTNFAAHGGTGLYGSNTYGMTHQNYGQGAQGQWMNVAQGRYDAQGRLILSSPW